MHLHPPYKLSGGAWMSRKTLAALFAAFAISAVPALAHHAFSANYDWKKPITLTGKVTKVEWTTPHTLVTVDGKDDHGTAGTWTVELGSPATLQHHGWNQSMLKAGEAITVDGWASKTNARMMNAMSVKMANGHDMFAGSSFFQMGTEENGGKPAATSGKK